MKFHLEPNLDGSATLVIEEESKHWPVASLQVSVKDIEALQAETRDYLLTMRGYEKHLLIADEVQQYDRFEVLGEFVQVRDVLAQSADRRVIQWADEEDLECEVMVHRDTEIAVWRRIE